jgi:hypothetical protein
MSLRRAALAALVASSLTWVPAYAQEEPPARPAAPAAEGEDCGAAPVAVVTRFLGLAPEQLQAFAQLLQARQATLGPILQQIAAREQRIRELVAAGGNPAEIGILMLQVHQLQQAAAAAQAQFLAGFAGVLNEEQRGRWEQVRAAARLQPVLPAFQALQVL